MVDGAKLQEILQENADLLEQMVDLEEETQYLLVHSDAGKLEALNMRKEKLITRMAELEEQRKGMFAAGTTLEQYLAAEEPPNRRELEELRKLILKRHASLQKKLRINRYLLRHNLHFTRQAMNCLFPGVKDAALYAASGEKSGQVPYPAGLVDSNA
ncbi:MAG: flagellar protein FlgN [Firmicutes bacterium]|mgnify:CR=1 FL=1|nr:flagellar protein FlgN [Bacillota bacterium]